MNVRYARQMYESPYRDDLEEMIGMVAFKNITHECGHAFQGYLSGKDPVREHADITMETAEIHLMFY